MTIMMWIIWMGGASAICDQVGILKAVVWPAYLGRYLAKVAMRDYLAVTMEPRK